MDLSKVNGPRISYLWGYNGQYPVAKVENTTYSAVTSVSGLDMGEIQNPTSDQSLRTELNRIRTELPNAMVTTYTYNPLIGVTSTTDPKGDTVYYEYDPFNRLKYVRDDNQRILKENEYIYKQD